MTKSPFDRRRRTKRRGRTWRYNPWAICYSQGLKKGTAKFERCVKHIKARQRRKRRTRTIWRKCGC